MILVTPGFVVQIAVENVVDSTVMDAGVVQTGVVEKSFGTIQERVAYLGKSLPVT